MAAYINDTVLDQALAYIANNVENLYLCSQKPTTFAQASSTYKLGVKAAPSVSAPVDATSGRKITVSEITDGTVSGTGTAAWIALTDDSASMLLVAQELNASQGVTAGNTFSLTAFDITIPDPIS